jgi:hypothetical protein
MIASRFHGMDALKGSAAEDLHYGLSTGYGWISEYRSRRFQKAFSRKIRMRPIRTITARLSGVVLSLAATLLAVDSNELATRVQEMADLDRVVSKAQRDYNQISHDATEQALYARFSADWLEYGLPPTRPALQSKRSETWRARLQLEIAPLARIELHIEPQTLLMVADAKLLSSLQQPVFLVSSLRFEVFNG